MKKYMVFFMIGFGWSYTSNAMGDGVSARMKSKQTKRVAPERLALTGSELENILALLKTCQSLITQINKYARMVESTQNETGKRAARNREFAIAQLDKLLPQFKRTVDAIPNEKMRGTLQQQIDEIAVKFSKKFDDKITELSKDSKGSAVVDAE